MVNNQAHLLAGYAIEMLRYRVCKSGSSANPVVVNTPVICPFHASLFTTPICKFEYPIILNN